MKISGAEKYEISDTNTSLKRAKVVIHNTGHHMRVLSESTYNRPIEAVVRETIANAMDASKGKKFDITAPSLLDPNFRVRDYGVGMDEDFFTDGYAAVGFSTKRDSNDEVGGFGQGRFAAFAYKACDAFFVRGIKDGKSFLGQVSRDHEFEIFVDVIKRDDTDEPNGVEVFVPVEVKDHKEFEAAIATYIEFLDPQPDCSVARPERKGLLEGADESWKIVDFDESSFRGGNRNSTADYAIPCRAIMGGIPYKFDLSNVFAYDTTSSMNISAIDVHFPIGSISLPTSREEIRYDDATKKVIKEKFAAIKKEINAMMAADQAKLQTDWEKWTDNSVMAYMKALNLHNGMKKFKSTEIPGLLSLQTLDKVREFEGRSTRVLESMAIAARHQYLIYLADEVQWRAKFQRDATDKANVPITTTNRYGHIETNAPEGFAIVVQDLTGIVALGNPPYVKISSLPKPAPKPRQIVAGTHIKTARVPELLVYKVDHGAWRIDPNPDFTVKDRIYWPFAVTKMETSHERLWDSIRSTPYAQGAVGVPKADQKLAVAAGWTRIDDALKKMCSSKDMVKAFSIYKNSEIFNRYPWDRRNAMEELYFLLKEGFRLPLAYRDLENKIKLVGPLVWNKTEIYNKLVEFMEGFMKMKPETGVDFELDAQYDAFMADHLLFQGTLEHGFYSDMFKALKADVPTLLAMAKKAL